MCLSILDEIEIVDDKGNQGAQQNTQQISRFTNTVLIQVYLYSRRDWKLRREVT
jgi:hypothetical protein